MSRQRLAAFAAALSAVCPGTPAAAQDGTVPGTRFTFPGWHTLAEALLYEVEIGAVRVSAARVLLAAVLFFAILFAAKAIRRWAGTSILSRPGADPALAYSIDRGLSYAGFSLAVLVALSYGGLDLSSLTIIAGALSVGIGFGLQQIASNFVAGAVLLAERPVKVGDRIAVKGHEGRVRRIGLRATELETDGRASLIVPNLDLVTSPIVNWTPHEPDGRVSVRVDVAHEADPCRVLAVLAAAADNVPHLGRFPPPEVRFDAIGPNALEFSILASPAATDGGTEAATRLRIAVLAALRAEGIPLARPQADVHLRDLDPLRAFLARAAEARLRQVSAASEAPEGKTEGT